MALNAAFYAFATAADAKSAWLEQLARVAVLNLEAGVIVDALLGSAPASEQVFATDADSRADLWRAFRALSAKRETSIWWRAVDGTAYELQQPLTDSFSTEAMQCVLDYEAACRANWKSKVAEINAASTAAAVIAIDLSDGWPDRACATGATIGDEYELAFDGGDAKPGASATIFRHVFKVAVRWPANFSGSAIKAATAATASSVCTIKLNGSSIGSATFAASGTSATIADVDAFDAAVDDLLEIVAPSSQDATLAGLYGTLAGRF